MMQRLLDRTHIRLLSWKAFLGWMLGASLWLWALSGSSPVVAGDPVIEAIRSFTVGEDLRDLQDPPTVFTAEITDSRILDITEVRVGLNLVGVSSGAGFASEMVVSLNKDLSATAILLNKVGVTLADGAGFGYDGWDVTFRDSATAGDVHALEWPSGVMTGEVQPDGRVLPESSDRPARLSALHGQVGNGTWRLSVADLHLGGTMRLESWSLTLVGKTNRAPTFVGLVDASIPESAEYRLPLVGRDADLPAQNLTITLVDGPVGAVVSAGEFRWTPPETAGGTTNTVRLSISDGVDSTVASFRLAVTEANQVPVFTGLSDVVLTNLSPYARTLVATDADVPVQSLTYALVSGPEGAEVVGNAFSWTPFEEQRPSTNAVRVSVSDGLVTVTNQFLIRLPAINTAPQLGAVANRSLREGVALGFNLQATDADVPANGLTFGLVSGPAGLTVSPAGRVSWVPSEAQGPGVFTVTVKVEDDGYPVLDDTETFQLTVTEVNGAPDIEPIANRDHDEGTPLSILLKAVDLDLPAQTTTFSLISGPTGMTVSSSGLLEWTPSELQGPSRQVVQVRATDSSGSSAETEFTVNVLEVPNPPVLPDLGSLTFNELVAASRTLGGSDPDIPAQSIRYDLVSGPPGLVVSADGRLTWTPTEAQGPGSYIAVVRISDDTGLSSERSYPITVAEVNRVPVLATVSSQSVGEGVEWSVALSGTDADLPANKLTYALVQGPVGMRVDSISGQVRWTPSETQGPSTNTVIVSVSDDAGSPLTSQTTFRVTVSEVNQAPVLAPVDDQPVTEGQPLGVTLSGTDSDVPLNVVRYRLVSPPTGMQINGITGRITWTPTTDQGPATYTIIAEAYDDADPSLSGRRTFQVIVMDSNRAPVANVQNLTGTEEVSLPIRLTATDADGDSMTYSVVTRPTKGTLAGFPPNLTYIPTVNAFGTDSFTFKANDGTVDSLPATVSITLTGVDDPPVVQGGQLVLSEDTPTAVTLNAVDPDGDPLSYTMVGAPQRGTLSGTPPNLTYTPNPDVSGPDQIAFKVTDGRTESAVATLNVTIVAVNDPPVIAPPPAQTVAEGALMTLDLTASDVDLPAPSIAFSLVSGPSGMTVSPAGRVGWTPTEAQGPSTNTVTVRASDGVGSSERSFEVVVLEVNAPPILVPVADPSVPEGDLLTLDLAGTDPDVPVQSLSFSLVAGPAGMTVSERGRLSWVPTPTQALSTPSVTVRVSDGSLSSDGTFRVSVTERILRAPPVFVGLSDAVVPEGRLYQQTLRGIDESGRTSGLSFYLVDGPAGASVDGNQFGWIPTEAQGPATHLVRVAVSNGRLASTNEFRITVTEINTPPVLPQLTSPSILEGGAYGLQLRAEDTDLPVQPLRYLLLEGPDGAQLTESGRFTWTPSERQGPSVNPVRIAVTDGEFEGNVAFTLTVLEDNQLPSFVGLGDVVITERVPYALRLVGSDSDIPLQPLTFRWVDGPAGSGVTNGVFAWVPGAVSSNTTYSVAVAVSDGVSSVTNRFSVVVTRSTGAPSFVGLSSGVITEGSPYQQVLRATHPVLPESALTLRWVSGPPGSVVEGTVFRWTPTEAQGPSTNLIRVAVSDGVTAETNTFTLVVQESNTAPVFRGLTNAVIAELSEYAQSIGVADDDLPAQTLSLRLVAGPVGARIVGTQFVWTPTEAQGPSTNVVRISAGDGFQSVTNAFTVMVREVPTPPSLALPTSRDVPESTPFVWVIPGTDSDLPAQSLTYRLLEGPAGAVLTNGVFAWTPDESLGGSSVALKIAVSDGESSVTNGVVLAVVEVNQPPVPTPLGTRRVNEGSLLSFTVGAIDADLPAQRLVYSLAQAPVGLTITSNGVVNWRPTEAQGPATNVVLVRVTDDGQPALSATNAIEIAVREVNQSPVLAPVADTSVDTLSELVIRLAATDADLPAQPLVYRVVSGPAGMAVDEQGVLRWVPTRAQAGRVSVQVSVSDGVATAIREFAVTVRLANAAPVFTVVSNRRVSEGSLITFTLTATDDDVPAQRLTYGLIQGPEGLTVGTNGLLSWRPTEAQGPSTNVVLVRVSDDGQPVLSATNAIEIVVREVNAAPAFDGVSPRTVKLPGSVVLTLRATDTDLPPQPLGYRLVTGPVGMTVSTNGALSWTPTEAQAASTNQVTVAVTDGTATVNTSFTVVVEASPRMALQVQGGTTVVIVVAGPPGVSCRLEQTDTVGGLWTAVAGVADIPTAGFNTPVSVNLPGPLQAGRLYRLRVP